MKTPEDYLKDWDAFGISDIEYLISIVQQETYNQAIEDVLENVELNLKSTDENAVYYKKAISCEFNGYGSTIMVDKDSIIKLRIDKHA